MNPSEIEIVKNAISLSRVKELAAQTYGEMVKAVVDLEQEIIAIGGEYHADAESKLLDQGSHQANLWGFNIYPDQPKETWLEYNSLINIRPHANNRSLTIQDKNIKNKIKKIIDQKII